MVFRSFCSKKVRQEFGYCRRKLGYLFIGSALEYAGSIESIDKYGHNLLQKHWVCWARSEDIEVVAQLGRGINLRTGLYDGG